MESEDLEYFKSFLDEFQEETDRGAALVGAAILDEGLLKILKTHFLKNKQSKELLECGTAPLGTFSSRIKACYCLGLITDLEYKELNLIRKIRNEFAHHAHGLDFEHIKVSALCKNLYDRSPIEQKGKISQSPRASFLDSVILTSIALLNRPKKTEKYKAQQHDWYS